MPIIAILITIFLEQRKLLTQVREVFNEKLVNYVRFFTHRSFNTPKELRYVYLFACLPIIVTLIIIKLLLFKYVIVYQLINLILFILSVEILTWKEEAKKHTQADNRSFISTYAIHFFAALFWFLVLPSAIGSICYLIIILISIELKNQALDSMIYNVVVDKMLFYANIIPYVILFVFIAIAGNFEEVTHFMVAQKKHFSKSFYFLENMLSEIVLIAIGKDKFQINPKLIVEGIEAGSINSERFTPKITAYIVAILYRAGLFFIGMLAIISIANLIS